MTKLRDSLEQTDWGKIIIIIFVGAIIISLLRSINKSNKSDCIEYFMEHDNMTFKQAKNRCENMDYMP